MNKTWIILFCLFASISVFAQREKPADEIELKGITQRGIDLAEYDVAAWHSTDAVMALSPKKGSFNGFIAKRNGGLWTVAYGKLNEKKDKYLIAYEAVQQSSPSDFKVQFFDKPKEEAGFCLKAANAVEVAKASFIPAQQRPYNIAVLPGKDGQFLIYFVPAQTQTGIFPLGGDIRYTVSSDGSKIIESRQLHKAIIEFQLPKGEKPVSGYHTAVLDDIPEDTDVFHVLAREPKVPELIVTQKYVYNIEVDGTIRYLMTTDAFKKVGKN